MNHTRQKLGYHSQYRDWAVVWIGKGLISSKGEIYLFSKAPVQWVPRLKQLDLEAGQLTPCSAEVKTGWSYISPSPLYLDGLLRDITFLHICDLNYV